VQINTAPHHFTHPVYRCSIYTDIEEVFRCWAIDLEGKFTIKRRGDVGFETLQYPSGTARFMD
jgi:hypothetical protein